MTSHEFETGRYLFCAVRLPERDGSVSDDSGTRPGPESFDAAGLDDRPVSVVAVDGLGAVVQPCESLFDSDDPTTVQRWLLRHQSVVDEAGETFGTPLPFQFDTIVTGDDERVREWLRSERETLTTALDTLVGHWEYRVEVVYDEAEARSDLEAEDERLGELATEMEESGAGKRFLLEKQYDQRLSRLLAEHRQDRASSLAADLEPHVREIHDLGKRASLGLDIDDDDGGDLLARLAILAAADSEDDIGDVLDGIAADPGVEVRFTGPWPPYTFAPALGDPEDGERSEGGTENSESTMQS